MTIKLYRKRNLVALRPYMVGEDLTGISVQENDTPEEGGMICMNPGKPDDKWYISKQYFEDNYELVEF